MTSFTGVQHLCTFNIVSLLFDTFSQMFVRRRTLSAHPSFLCSVLITLQHGYVHLLCCTGSLAEVLSLWPSSHGLKRKRWHVVVQNPNVVYDNAGSHTAASNTDLLSRWQCQILKHPPYSPGFWNKSLHLQPLQRCYCRVPTGRPTGNTWNTGVILVFNLHTGCTEIILKFVIKYWKNWMKQVPSF